MVYNFDLEIFATRIKELRNKRGFSTEKLGKAIGVSNASITRWERMQRMPSLENAFNLAHFFGVSIDFLAGKSEANS